VHDVLHSRDVRAAPAEPTQVVVVADVRLYREGLAAHLACRPDLKVLGTASDRESALALCAAVQPQVIVVDMGTRDGLDIVRATKALNAGVKVVAFGMDESESDVVACAEAGVDGCLPYDGSIDDLVAAIASCTRGELICSPRIAAILFRRVGALGSGHSEGIDRSGLTTRERQIVNLIDGGLSNKEIALRLNIEVPTVKNHVHNILEKLNVATRAEAAARLRGRGLREGHGRASAASPAARRETAPEV
jgi:two-component system nitrate/nitrite response regulator NarL